MGVISVLDYLYEDASEFFLQRKRDKFDLRKDSNYSKSGSKNSQSKFTESMVADIRTNSLTKKQAMEKYQMSDTAYYDIKNYKTWKHVA